jgi:translocator protein
MQDISGARSLTALVFWVGLCVAVGIISGLLTRRAIPSWYASLRKPSFNPPNWIFGPVWMTLYVLMGVAAWMAWQQPSSQLRTYALAWFLIQLGLNFLWSLIFFRWHAIAGALGEISILWLAILATMVLFWELHPPAGWLMVPYLAWVSFATMLNLGIFRLNRNR